MSVDSCPGWGPCFVGVLKYEKTSLDGLRRRFLRISDGLNRLWRW